MVGAIKKIESQTPKSYDGSYKKAINAMFKKAATKLYTYKMILS